MRFPRDRRSATRTEGAREAEMGFLFYANFVRFVLEGAYTHILMERARVWMKAAGMMPPH
jgi:hypothetical protein